MGGILTITLSPVCVASLKACGVINDGFSNVLWTCTFADVKIVGSVSTNKENPENLRKAYSDTDEADASSIMMDGTYREMKLKNRQWDNKAEEWHQWQMAYTRMALDEKKIIPFQKHE